MKKLLGFLTVLLAALWFAPVAANATLSNGKPYCVADLSQPAQGYTQSNFSPAITCYATYADYSDRLALINKNGGWLLATTYVDSNLSGPRIGFFAPSNYGACGKHDFLVDHMPDTYNDQISSYAVYDQGGATCNIGFWYKDANQSGTRWSGAANGGDAVGYTTCKVYSMGSNNDTLSSFELTQQNHWIPGDDNSVWSCPN